MTHNTVQIDFIHAVFDLLMENQQDEHQFKRRLKEKLDELGITRFISDVAAPLGELVGQRWQENRAHIFVEHFYTSQMNGLFNDLIVHHEAIYQQGTPKILLCTAMGERHALGSTMTQALLCSEGAFCINLGSELPISEIVDAVDYYQMDVVGLSFSLVFNKRMMISIINQLREKLPPHIQLWVGGNGTRHLSDMPNIKILTSAEEIVDAYQQTKQKMLTHCVDTHTQ